MAASDAPARGGMVGLRWRAASLAALAVVLVAVASAGAVVPSDPISRIAGIGAAGNDGDGGPAMLAQLDAPQGVAVDARGRVYIADGGNGRVRRIDEDGAIRAAGGPFGEPADVAVDAQGRVFVAGASDNRVWLVGSAGTVTPFAGTGAPGSGGDGGAAAAAQLNEPRGVAVDAAGNVYVAETGGDRIRRIGGDGVITTVAGTGTPGFAGDGGPAAAAQLWGPRDIAVAPDGTVVVVDSNNGRVRRIGGDGSIRTIAGNGDFPGACPAAPADAGATPLAFPTSAAVDRSGNVYVASDGCVAKVTPAGAIQRIAGNGTTGTDSGDGGPASAALLSPSGLAVDPGGSLVISTGLANRVRRVLNVPPAAAFSATAVAPLTVDVDASASSAGQAGEPLALVSWDFGDGAGGAGTTARHVYAAAGSYVVGLTVRDDSGAVASTTRVVTVAPPPFAASLTASSVAGRYGRGGLRASLALRGSANGAGSVTVGLVRLSGPRAPGLATRASVLLRVARAGAFSSRLALPRRLAPGAYALRLGATAVAGAAGRVTIGTPRTGILRRAFVTAVARNASAGTSFPRPVRRLFCHFQFSVLPAPSRALALSTEWTVPGGRLGRVVKPRTRSVVGVLFRQSGLGAGRYSCALRVGRTVVATIGARVR